MAFTPVFYTYLPLSGERGRKELAELKGTMFNPTLQPPSSRLMKSNFYFGSSDAGAARFHCFPTSGRLSFRSFFPPETYLPVPFLSDSFVGRIFHARNVFPANIVNAFVAPKSWSCPLSREWITISPDYSTRAFHRVAFLPFSKIRRNGPLQVAKFPFASRKSKILAGTGDRERWEG